MGDNPALSNTGDGEAENFCSNASGHQGQTGCSAREYLDVLKTDRAVY